MTKVTIWYGHDFRRYREVGDEKIDKQGQCWVCRQVKVPLSLAPNAELAGLVKNGRPVLEWVKTNNKE